MFDQWRNDEWLRSLGFGVPFAFAALGLGLTYAAAPGLATFGAQNRYAQLGLAVMMLLSIASYAVAFETHRRIDPEWWLFRKDAADEVEVFDDNTTEPEGSD